MGIFKAIHAARARTKAEIKAAKTRAKSEAKQAARLDLKRAKLLSRQEKLLLNTEKKALRSRRKHERKMAKDILANRRQGVINRKNLSRWSGAARFALPLLLPLFYRIATTARQQLDSTENGTDTNYPGSHEPEQHTAQELNSRITTIENDLTNPKLPQGFITDVQARLEELKLAIKNTADMAPQQRRRAQTTISRDLNLVSDQIEDRLLDS